MTSINLCWGIVIVISTVSNVKPRNSIFVEGKAVLSAASWSPRCSQVFSNSARCAATCVQVRATPAKSSTYMRACLCHFCPSNKQAHLRRVAEQHPTTGSQMMDRYRCVCGFCARSPVDGNPRDPLSADDTRVQGRTSKGNSQYQI